MKSISEYIETALGFERRAAAEPASGLKTSFEKQAIAYRKLAAPVSYTHLTLPTILRV